MDYNLSNNKLLIELKNEQNELKSIMNELKMNNMLTSAVITTTPARPLTQTRAILDAETLKRRYLLTDNYDDDDDDDRSSNMSTLSICYSNSSADSTFIGSEISEDNTTINDDYDDQSFDISIDEVNYMNNTYKTALGESFGGIINNVTNILFLDNSHNSFFSIIF
jgi:hypothetical protein